MTIPKYSKEVQERIDQEKAKNTPNIPTLHSNRIRLQGEEGLFYIREHDESGKMKAEENPLGKTPHQVWSGTILRIAYKVESKWKKDATEKEFTSEFDNFSNEPIDLLVRNFGADGKTELIKTYKN